MVDRAVFNLMFPACASDELRLTTPELASTLDCYYGQRDYPRARVLEDRRTSAPGGAHRHYQSIVLRSSTGGALSIEYDVRFSSGASIVFELIVAMEQREGRWWIIAETDRAHIDCLSSADRDLVADTTAPEEIRRCAGTNERCRQRCRNLSDPYPGEYGDCQLPCSCEPYACLGLPNDNPLCQPTGDVDERQR